MIEARVLAAGVLAAALAVAAASATPDPRPLVSGKMIPVGTIDGRGPLACYSVSSYPIGAAHVFGGEQPDLFVRSGGHGAVLGLYLYRWVATDESGAPVFADPVLVGHPFDGATPNAGCVFEWGDPPAPMAAFLSGSSVMFATYNAAARRFEEAGTISLSGRLPRNASNIEVLANPDGSAELILEVRDGVSTRPDDFGHRDARYRPYDGAGIWRGGMPYATLYAARVSGIPSGSVSLVRRIASRDNEALMNLAGIAALNLGPGRERDILTGTRLGDYHHYRNSSAAGLDVSPRVLAKSRAGVGLRHPAINASPVRYPSPVSGRSDFLSGGESQVFFVKSTGEFAPDGAAIFEDPLFALEQDAKLYSFSLPVFSSVDWDGDGANDLVGGTSGGFVYLFRNAGTNLAPAFLAPVPLEADGKVIHVQPGYRGSIQGPQESRWGYVCPTAVDWNEDGLPDLVLSSALATHVVYINEGSPGEPRLGPPLTIFCDGLELHGTWRVQPAVARMGARMAYVALDAQDEFHLYWRLDDQNVEDGGKLLLEDGRVVRANFLAAGGTGRLKIHLVDWDRDGKMDLLVGTPRHGSVPDPVEGLPQSLGLPGSSVLLLRNVGTNEAPRFEEPRIFHHDGVPLFLGQHACGPAPVWFGGIGGPHLVVGEESGRVIYFDRSRLTLAVPTEAQASAARNFLQAEVLAILGGGVPE